MLQSFNNTYFLSVIQIVYICYSTYYHNHILRNLVTLLHFINFWIFIWRQILKVRNPTLWAFLSNHFHNFQFLTSSHTSFVINKLKNKFKKPIMKLQKYVSHISVMSIHYTDVNWLKLLQNNSYGKGTIVCSIHKKSFQRILKCIWYNN